MFSISNVVRRPPREQGQLEALIKVYNAHWQKNGMKNRYYEGHITLNEVNLGIALPAGIAGDIMSALINMGYPEDSVRTVLNEHKPESDNFETEFKRYMKLMRNA